ncbi:radical SAM protein [Dactylosporangium sp. NPDC000244]|uniref:radical SAM protein n=1 Tax=Dactylosporangium sp. NPDC000244 TaxID=3154365 RepID=UPI00332D2CB5
MTIPRPVAGGQLTEAELPIIHLILNTDCNAWQLEATSGSPGVCKFCYRERNRVQADRDTVLRVLDALRAESAAHRVVFTGGDPLMPYDNHVETAVRHASELGFAVNMHTNGLLLQDRFHGLREWIDVYSLAIDGPDAQLADWFRGRGYFDRFTANVAMLADHGKTLAFNTFTAANSIGRLPETAAMIRSVAQRTRVEYWLISQYRPIGRADARKADIYGYATEQFRSAIAAVRDDLGSVQIFDQPTRAETDPYPFRAWVLADGAVTVDLGSVAAPRNTALGNLLEIGLAPLIRQAHALRHNEFDHPDTKEGVL